jgi:8-oxo-dGTP pyrophosphatase MutT (NUDIX family)
MDIDFIERLERRLILDLPGRDAHLLMAPNPGRITDAYFEAKSDAIEASVLILLYPKDNSWHVALIQRTHKNEKDPHKGQLSLPGGKIEESDDSYEECALREAQEEIGIDPVDVAILGQLSSLYVYVSNFLVFPFVGFTDQEQNFSPQPSEVDMIYEVPLEVFAEDKFRKKKDLQVRGTTFKDVPFFDLHGDILWGATAMILSEFGELIKPIIKE